MLGNMERKSPNRTREKAVENVAGEAESADPLTRLLCFSVYAANLAFHRAYKAKLDALNITYPQYLTLLLLRARSGQSVKEIGGHLSLDSNTLTPMIQRLEASGLVRRRRDADDQRVVHVDITAEGRKIADLSSCVTDELASAVKISEKDVRLLQAMLGDLTAQLPQAGSDKN